MADSESSLVLTSMTLLTTNGTSIFTNTTNTNSYSAGGSSSNSYQISNAASSNAQGSPKNSSKSSSKETSFSSDKSISPETKANKYEPSSYQYEADSSFKQERTYNNHGGNYSAISSNGMFSTTLDHKLRPGEFVMRILFSEFTAQAEKKIEMVMTEPPVC